MKLSRLHQSGSQAALSQQLSTEVFLQTCDGYFSRPLGVWGTDERETNERINS